MYVRTSARQERFVEQSGCLVIEQLFGNTCLPFSIRRGGSPVPDTGNPTVGSPAVGFLVEELSASASCAYPWPPGHGGPPLRAVPTPGTQPTNGHHRPHPDLQPRWLRWSLGTTSIPALAERDHEARWRELGAPLLRRSRSLRKCNSYRRLRKTTDRPIACTSALVTNSLSRVRRIHLRLVPQKQI